MYGVEQPIGTCDLLAIPNDAWQSLPTHEGDRGEMVAALMRLAMMRPAECLLTLRRPLIVAMEVDPSSVLPSLAMGSETASLLSEGEPTEETDWHDVTLHLRPVRQWRQRVRITSITRGRMAPIGSDDMPDPDLCDTVLSVRRRDRKQTAKPNGSEGASPMPV